MENRDAVHANMALAAAIEKLATALERLGKDNAVGGMGAIEMLASEIKDGSTRIAEAIEGFSP